MPIRCRLSRILGERRIKVTHLAEQTGITKKTILSLYHERSQGITFAVLEKICEALDIEPGQLLEWEKE